MFQCNLASDHSLPKLDIHPQLVLNRHLGRTFKEASTAT